MRLQSCFLLVCLALLAGCNASGIDINYVDTSHVQPGASITVQNGDTVYGLAKKNKVDMRELIAVNRLQPPYALAPGQQINLPALGKVPPGGSLQPSASPRIAVETQPLMSSSVQSEPLPPPGKMQALEWNTQPLKTPSQLKQQTEEVPPLVTEKVVSSTANPQSITSLSQPDMEHPKQGAITLDPSSDFRWPVEGPISSKFGAKAKGLNNDGINISAPRGSPVLASAGGTVVYAGNEMKGFGNLVLIRHEDNWVTAYAHLERILVERNSVVAAGDMIGTVGTSGGVANPQLHFEVRHGGKAQNPETLLPKL